MKRHESTAVHNNMFGYRGVEWEQASRKYRARIEPGNDRRGRWLGRFGTPEEAARAYDEAAREVYGDEAYLNFPMAGEKQTIRSAKERGMCPKGHDYSVHGYKTTRGVNCRICNSEARKRSYRKRKSLAASAANPT